MTNRLEELSITFDQSPVPAHLQDVISDATALREEFYERRGEDRIPGFTGTGPSVAWSLLTSLREQIPECGETFCEWGSGLGIVSCLAESLGWHAKGLEIEPALVDASTHFARKHGFESAFYIGSYRVENAANIPDLAPGIGLFDFDVIFAYTWPAEVESVTEIVQRFAHPGTLFVRYLGGIQFSVFRVVGD